MKVCKCCGNRAEAYGAGGMHSGEPYTEEQKAELRESLSRYESVLVTDYGYEAHNMVCVLCLEGGCPCYGTDLEETDAKVELPAG